MAEFRASRSDFERMLHLRARGFAPVTVSPRPSKTLKGVAVSSRLADVVHGEIQKIQIVSIEEWFKGKLPKLPPLEHLPTAAFSTVKRRAGTKAPDPRHPELPLVFAGGKTAELKTYLNPTMMAAQKDNALKAPDAGQEPRTA